MKIYYIIKLSRPLNLIIIALTMVLLRYLIEIPVLEKNNIYLVITNFDFALVLISTIFIAAAGNIINDYFDIKPDRLNKHRKVIVGRYITRREAMVSHLVLNTLGFFTAGYVAHKYHIDWVLIFQLMAITLLWFYSGSFKKSFIVGNLIVAFLTANIPLIVIGFDLPALFYTQGFHFPFLHINIKPVLNLIYFTLVYSAFAFLLNLSREMVKDIADIRGDRESNAQTLPISLGIKSTKQIVNSLILFTIILLVYIQQVYLPDRLTSIYLLITVIIPLIISTIKLKNAYKSKHYIKAGNQIKLAMGGGLGYMIVFYFYVINHY